MQMLLHEAVAAGTDIRHDLATKNEVFRYSEMHALLFSNEIPDYLAELLEARENLDRQELSAKEKTAHVIKIAEIVKEHAIINEANYQQVVNNSPVKKSRGRPIEKPILKATSEQTGLHPMTIKNRLKAAEPIIGPIDLEKDTADELAAKRRKLEQSEAEDRASKNGKVSVTIGPQHAKKLIDRFREWLKDGKMTLAHIAAYRDALNELLKEEENV
jgi:hypothetical protein